MRTKEIIGLVVLGVFLAVVLWPRSATGLVVHSQTVSENNWWEPWWWNGFRPRPQPQPEHNRLGPGGGTQEGGNVRPGGWVGGGGHGRQEGGNLQPSGWVGGGGHGELHPM